jgi:hypothetical protein
VRAELQTVHALGEQLLTLAQQVQDSAMTLWYLGYPDQALARSAAGAW